MSVRLLHTYYKLASVADYAAYPADTPIYTPEGALIAVVPSTFAFELSIEGSGQLADGRVVNFSSVGGTCRTPPGYQGTSSCYRVLDASRYPWGAGHRVALVPLRSIAVDPRAIPFGSDVYIREFDGLSIPRLGGVGGFTHDGWFRADDSGGAIGGNHIDVFAGPTVMYRWLEHTLPTSYPNGAGLHADIYPPGTHRARAPTTSAAPASGLLAVGAAGLAGWLAWRYLQQHPPPARRRRHA